MKNQGPIKPTGFTISEEERERLIQQVQKVLLEDLERWRLDPDWIYVPSFWDEDEGYWDEDRKDEEMAT